MVRSLRWICVAWCPKAKCRKNGRIWCAIPMLRVRALSRVLCSGSWTLPSSWLRKKRVQMGYRSTAGFTYPTGYMAVGHNESKARIQDLFCVTHLGECQMSNHKEKVKGLKKLNGFLQIHNFIWRPENMRNIASGRQETPKYRWQKQTSRIHSGRFKTKRFTCHDLML